MPSLDAAAAPVLGDQCLTSLQRGTDVPAYGVFGLSSVAALMYLSRKHNLKFHKLQAFSLACHRFSG